MKVTLAALVGIVAGAAGAIYVRRYIGAFAWWVFTRIPP